MRYRDTGKMSVLIANVLTALRSKTLIADLSIYSPMIYNYI